MDIYTVDGKPEFRAAVVNEVVSHELGDAPAREIVYQGPLGVGEEVRIIAPWPSIAEGRAYVVIPYAEVRQRVPEPGEYEKVTTPDRRIYLILCSWWSASTSRKRSS
jgi:hypothetical protein